jgi:phytol kinase
MDNPIFALVLPSLLIVPAMGLLSSVRSHSPIGQEIRRKALHLSIGLAALSFPYLLAEPWMVIAASLLVISWMLAVRMIPALNRRFGCVLHDAGRVSHGELYFAVAVAALLLLPHANPVLYVIPLLVLTIADAAAAVVGRAWPVGELGGLARGKTLSGSAAFVASAFLISFLFLDFYTSLATLQILSIAFRIAALTCIAEAISSRGLDNLFVPAIAWLVLYSTIGGAWS